MFILLPLFAVLSLSFQLFCMLCVNWWAPLFCDATGWLPNWLAWVQTFDDTLDAGKRDGLYPNSSVFWSRVFWLYRNSGYGFDYWALGTGFNSSQWTIKSMDLIPASFTFYAIGPRGTFNLDVVRGPIHLKLGWKAWNMYNQYSHPPGWRPVAWGPQWRIPFVFSISLYKG